MKKAQIVSLIIAIAKMAESYDDFYDRLYALDKALKTWRIHGGICYIHSFVDDDVTDPNDPAWSIVTVMRWGMVDFKVDCSEYMKGKP